ncbi:uncharacterized protein LTR77_006932 [Saxophila tyrrhenica]|uniref:Glycosyl hydrolase family 13 catalytic domain-containing protein n=1 Tax=Saxophila tyrrhenica TaxID=1690608 RepID=A0AAV9P6C2_9PEZI|nr:hypothetical protein LTR77_006932 [Saxophila tyrrhenica]
MSSNTFSSPAWWKESCIYQIYPASFKSSPNNKSGWGDIKGITSKLDYLKDLGVDILWLSPIFKSPQVDMGYDISDYKDIDPTYGSLDDVDELISKLKDRDMKLMMDLVVNHTSDQHAWFQDSRSSKTSSKRDWYIWQPPRYDADGNRQPPNNWALILGEANSAWTWDEHTQEYFLALFTPEQPDLNWRNPAVREAVHDVLRFWLDRGVCGFRMDVINHISKVSGYPDAKIIDPSAPYQPGHAHYANGPELHNYLQEIHSEVLSKYPTITVGEMPFVKDDSEILRVVSPDRNELNMIFIFELVDVDNVPGSFRLTRHEWHPRDLRRIVSRWQNVMQECNGWNSVFIENHDNPRSLTRYVDDSDQFRDLGAKLLALMQSTLSGTLYVYQGEELGMRDLPPEIPPEEYRDIESQNFWRKSLSLYPNNEKGGLDDARKTLQRKARDHARTPVPWSPEGPNAGFCDEGVEPWMCLNPDFTSYNASAQQNPPEGSGEGLTVFQFWRRALRNRKEHANTFVYGTFTELPSNATEEVFAYTKTAADGKEAFVVVLNFSGKEVEWAVPEGVSVERWVAGNWDDDGADKGTSGEIKLRAWEGLLGMVKV